MPDRPAGLDPVQQWLLERIVSLQAQFFAGAEPEQAARAAALWLLAQPGPPAVHAALRAMLSPAAPAPPATSIRPPSFERFSVMPDGSANWLDEAIEMVNTLPPPPAAPTGTGAQPSRIPSGSGAGKGGKKRK